MFTSLFSKGHAWNNVLTQISVEMTLLRLAENTHLTWPQRSGYRVPLIKDEFPWSLICIELVLFFLSGPYSSKRFGKSSWKQGILHVLQFLLPYLWACWGGKKEHGIRGARQRPVRHGPPEHSRELAGAFTAHLTNSVVRSKLKGSCLMVMGLSGVVCAKTRAMSVCASDQTAFPMGLIVGLNLILLTDVFMDAGGSSEALHRPLNTV